jgi:Secretion system C-terminal sorting domain
MKRLTLLLLCLCYGVLVFAQVGPDYPTPITPSSLQKFEYFMDVDPGFGLGTSATATGTDVSNATAVVDISSLPRGVHQLFIRSFDTDKKWSLTNAVTFENFLPDYPTAATAPDVTKLEYFIDADPGFELGSPVSVTPSTDTNIPTANIALGSLTPGVHQLSIRSKDAAKHWSITNVSTLENLQPMYVAPPIASNIVKLEYFVKNDLGFENGITIPVTPSADIHSLTTSVDITAAVPVGVQTFFIRSKDNLGRWSLSNFSIFDNATFVYPPAPDPPRNISRIEYFVDTDPGFGNGTVISATPNADISIPSASIDLNSLASGEHVFYIRSLSNGWSLTNISVFSSAVLPISLISFTGLSAQGKNILTWSTASELNNDRFDIERADAQTELIFTKIGTVAGSGTKITQSDYSFIDESPNASQQYYRLKQVDLDGHFEYSPVILVIVVGTTPSMENLVTAYPNPASDKLIVEFGNKIENIEPKISIIDLMGRPYDATHTLLGRTLQFDIRSLPSGFYFLRIGYNNEKQFIRFVKK